jgi:type IV secretion system protein VirB5
MSSRAIPTDILQPKHALLTDEIGNEVYASHYAERKAYRMILACGTVLLLGSMGLNLSLARRPIANRYIRIDEMGRAQAIQYSDLNYSPREGEVRTYLTDWANYRYTISRDTIAKKYPLNYYFLSGNLSSQLMTDDNANHLVSQVIGGQIEQSDDEVKNVTITSMSQETVQGAIISRGTALIALDKLYSPRNSHEPRVEHWGISVTYYLNPKQVSDQAKVFPQFETINPLGLTITEFHENRLSVDPIAPGASATAPAIPAQSTAGETR